MVEDFVCIGRRNVIHYAAFSEGGLRPFATGAVKPTESGLIFDSVPRSHISAKEDTGLKRIG